MSSRGYGEAWLIIILSMCRQLIVQNAAPSVAVGSAGGGFADRDGTTDMLTTRAPPTLEILGADPEG